MGDPVSVAASAAGLIALGLESCKLINAAVLPPIAADITAKVLENENWIKEVHNAVTKWQSATQNLGLGGKVRAAGKKIAYPFRREALLDTIKVLEGLQMNLHTSLLLLQLQQTSSLAKQTDRTDLVHTTRYFYPITLGWPEGFRALLEFVPNLTRNEIGCLVRHAVIFDALHAAEALLKLGAPVSAYEIADCKSNAMEILIMETLISERRRLLELAESTLSRRARDELGLRVGSLPDENARAVFLQLKARNPGINPSLEPEDWQPIYHNSMKIDQMEYLYNAGIHDINAPYQMVCPVLKIAWLLDWPLTEQNISRVLWLIGKGAEFNPEGITARPSSHTIAINITTTLMYDAEFCRGRGTNITPNILTSLPHTHRNFLRNLFSLSCRDSCFCACSSAGCTPLTVAISDLLYLHHLWEVSPDAGVLKIIVTEIQETAGCGNKMIRLLSFQDLALTHTCCRTDPVFGEDKIILFDKEDAAEIHDEERILIEEFEALVEELEKEYEAMGVPLWEFIQTHWCERVREYLVEHEEIITPKLLCDVLARRVVEDE
ncbi:hypothetical protein BJX62DRAFT_243690 [Aspergillus germanicus]